MKKEDNLLEGRRVLEFCTHPSGEIAGLRLAELGAEVIKITMEPKKEFFQNESRGGSYERLQFQILNHGKESAILDFETVQGKKLLQDLIQNADVLMEDQGTEWMQHFDLDAETIQRENPSLIYGSISGYGAAVQWEKRPVSDLLVQAVSGIPWLNGNGDQPPLLFGLNILDSFAGTQLAQGILACLIRKEKTQAGGRVSVSLLESAIDLQFEMTTTYWNNGNQMPKRSCYNNALAYLSAPYGIYQTRNGFIALSFIPISRLMEALKLPKLLPFCVPQAEFKKRDEIKRIIGEAVRKQNTEELILQLTKAGCWCSDVYDWKKLVQSEAFRVLDFTMKIEEGITLTRCPITRNRTRIKCRKPAPYPGEHTKKLQQEAETIWKKNKVQQKQKEHKKQEIPRPLEGLFVVDFSQYLAGPSVGLRLSDFGAEVVKIENREKGDGSRHTYISDVKIDGDSTIYHAINRKKASVAWNLKDPEEKKLACALLKKADVMLINFRPGVAKRLGLDYESVKKINPQIVYGEVSGYGEEGPFREMPGQDLLVQALSGLCYLNGNADQPPTPFGLAIVDMITGQHLALGVLAAVYQKKLQGKGAYIQCSLLESALDLQSQVFSVYLNHPGELPKRSARSNAGVYLDAPAGIYQTRSGYLAVDACPLDLFAGAAGDSEEGKLSGSSSSWEEREEKKKQIEEIMLKKTAQEWEECLHRAGIPCSAVLSFPELCKRKEFQELAMCQTVFRKNGTSLLTSRCPVQIDGKVLKSPVGAPALGEDNAEYEELARRILTCCRERI